MDPLIEAVSSALELLSDREKWVQNIRAGKPVPIPWTKEPVMRMERVSPKDPEATCWCVSGAVEKFLPGDRPTIVPQMDRFNKAFRIASETGMHPEQYNDLYAYPSVIAMLRRTYEKLVLIQAQSTEITNTKTK